MRPERHKYVGYIFYVTALVNLLLSQKGMTFIGDLLDFLSTQTTSAFNFLVALAALVSLLITSEAIGYIFSNIFSLYWNWRGGYSSEWAKCGYNIKDTLKSRYSQKNVSNQEEKWQNPGHDVVLSYFWQRGDRHIVEWVSRRHTMFFTGMSALIGFGCALILSSVIILTLGLGWHALNWVVVGIAVIFMVIIWFNSHFEKKAARQMVDLWLSTLFDANMQSATRDIEQHVQNRTGTANSAQAGEDDRDNNMQAGG